MIRIFLLSAYVFLIPLSPVRADRVVVFEQEDGNVGFVVPAPGNSAASVAATVLSPGVRFRLIDRADITLNPVFRGAWIYSPTAPGGATFSPARARGVCRKNIMAMLRPLVADLALVSDSVAAEKKMRWRSLLTDPRIDSATTEAEFIQILNEAKAQIASD